MTKSERSFYWMAYIALGVLALGTFTSVSFTALAHILLLPSGLYFYKKNLSEKSFKPRPSLYALAALAVISIFSVLVNWEEMEKPLKNILKTKYFIIGILSSYAFHYLKQNWLNPKRIKILVNLFLFAAMLASLSGLIGLWSGFNPLKFKPPCHPTRACGLYGMYMTYGYGISLFMVLATGLLVYRDRFKSYFTPWLLYSSLGVCFLGLIFSYARGGWLGFALGVPFLFVKNHPKRMVVSFILMALIGGGIFISSSRVQYTVLKRKTSNKERIHFFEAAYAAFKEKPLLGYGYKNFEANSKEIKKRHNIGGQHFGGHAHNNALEHLASTGALGFLGFIIFCLLWLKESYREPIVFAFVVSFLVSGLFQYTFGDGENLFLIFAIFGLFA